MIDLHLHTTASDGSLPPDQLVSEAAAAGVRTLAVTDHDTVAGLAAAAAAAGQFGMTLVTGIEITAVHDDRDLHVLGYFFDPDHADLAAFLTTQLQDRRRRLIAMADRLRDLDLPVDLSHLDLDGAAGARRSFGRPLLAAAMVTAGHVRSVHEAFDRYLSAGRPAFVSRVGAAPSTVAALVAAAGGVTSLAHPGRLDEAVVSAIVDGGFDAIEVYHPDHDHDDTERWREMARRKQLAMSGGSDFHGAATGKVNALGRIDLPSEAFAALKERAAARGRARG